MSMEQEKPSNTNGTDSIAPGFNSGPFHSATVGSTSSETGIDATATVKPAPGSRATARLVEYANGRYIALPPHTTYALADQPAYDSAPGVAHYAYGLLTWQGTRLPLLDLNALLHGNPSAVQSTPPRYALIVAYQRVARGPLEYGAIGMNSLPQTISIGDEAQCALPGDSRLWPQLALSCFQHDENTVPILDTSLLFSAYHG